MGKLCLPMCCHPATTTWANEFAHATLAGETTSVRARIRIVTRGAVIRLAILFALLFGALTGAYVTMIRMPGKSFTGPLPALTPQQVALRDSLRRDVEVIAGRIGVRNLYRYDNLTAAMQFIEDAAAQAGYEVERQTFEAGGKQCVNLAVEIAGTSRADGIVVIGGHYDSVPGCPAANDNATGVAATLELARTFAARKPRRSIRFLAFVNEEPPYFQTDSMGSRVYARRCRERGDKVVAMLSLETMGYYSDEKGSQRYPVPFGLMYPSTGNFIAFVGNFSSRKLVRQAVASFREHTQFPSEMGALPGGIPGVGWSDHWSFWQEGYPALMVTDTAPYRYDHYHEASDTPDKVDYDRLARVVAGLAKVLEDLANPAESK